jgi:hypothetical protein
LLLFAIVLGMAALAASLSQPVDERKNDLPPRQAREPGPPTGAPQPASVGPSTLSLDAAENDAVRLPAGEAATLEVSVEEPGSIEIPELGLSATADVLTPARFDVLAMEPGRYDLTFTPAADQQSEAAGKLVVTSPG